MDTMACDVCGLIFELATLDSLECPNCGSESLRAATETEEDAGATSTLASVDAGGGRRWA